MPDFRESAALLAKRMQVMKDLQRVARQEGRTHLSIHVLALFSENDQAALDAYERDLAAYTGQVPLPLGETG